jgi:hypothetical protein
MTDREDDATFQELDPDSDRAFGPPAILVIGFTAVQLREELMAERAAMQS